MRTYRTNAGPFAERSFYPDADVESICIDELSKLGLLPSQPEAIRIDRFIEKRFVTPSYEDLGEGILGLTRFSKNGVSAVVVSSRLDAEGGKVSERRIRTTLGHEGGHGLLHTHLFVLGSEKKSLFGDFSDPSKPKVMCRDDHYSGQWWEVQANMAMGSLLMPRHLVEIAIEPYLTEQGLMGIKTLMSNDKWRAERELAEVFDVNPAVVRIRIVQLYPAVNSGQLTL
jgi:hypothetical protein